MNPAQLGREEYIEQAYFYRVFRERLEEAATAQEILVSVREEILSTTRLPIAIDFLAGELQLHGRIGQGMSRLLHYFTPFQAFIMQKAEDEESRFDFRIALQILEREAEYRAAENVQQAALFVYQFECVARNRLGYDEGMLAMSRDPQYERAWQEWIARIRFQLGTVDFADLVYLRSQFRVEEIRRQPGKTDYQPTYSVLFGIQEGRIAKANFGKDPLYMFAALQRQLSYPAVPKPRPPRTGPLYEPHVDLRFQRLENRLQLVEQELKGSVDMSLLVKKPQDDDS